MANKRELTKIFRTIILEIFPELRGYHFPIRARVTKVHESGGRIGEFEKRYSVDVQPLKPDGTVDESSPEIPDVEIPVAWAGPDRGIFCLPVIGAIVRIGFYYADPAYPFVDALLGEGFEVPDHALGSLIIQHSEGTRIEIDPEKNIRITNPGAEPKIYFYTGDHPVAFADIVKQIFDAHGHPYSWGHDPGSGTTGLPTSPMIGHDSQKVFTG